MSILAIQTVYKGCRFRSRLEARGAVFFDTLGIAWVSQQGYDMDGIPTLDEIKAGMAPPVALW